MNGPNQSPQADPLDLGAGQMGQLEEQRRFNRAATKLAEARRLNRFG